MAGVKREGLAAVGNASGAAAPVRAPAPAAASYPPPNPPDAYRMVDFVKAVAMRDDRGQEVRVQRVRRLAPVDRESTMRVESIVLNGTWFDITCAVEGREPQVYRVHVTNTVSAER